ncbi:MAG: energy transducer TonB [Bacteroidales bacterium]|nr:energy transducer TonB [Bacteroidales bacterium]
MEDRFRERNIEDRASGAIGIALTVLVHACLLVFVSLSGMKYNPHPQEITDILMEFEDIPEPEAVPEPEMERKGLEPRSENANPDEKVELVRKSESPQVGKKPNLTPETKTDRHGDVEVPAPKATEEPKLDARASFPGMAKKDTSLTAPHSASSQSDNFKAGQADGNARTAKIEGKANAQVEGRSVLGALPKPQYNLQEDGIVVMRVTVNQEGRVTSAVNDVSRSTVSASELIKAARNAAMSTKFNNKPDAPASQSGTITYRFTLK